MEEPLGEHFIIELYDCTGNILDNLERIQSELLEAARIAKATVIDHCFHKFSPQGVSGVVVIAESHLSIHTWPEYGYAAIDLFSCSSTMEMDRVFDLLKRAFGPGELNVRRIPRGILNPALRKALESGREKMLV